MNRIQLKSQSDFKFLQDLIRKSQQLNDLM